MRSNRTNGCIHNRISFIRAIHPYGKPDLDLEMDSTQRSSGSSFDDLNSQSFLNSYGYNVNQTEGLSESYRQELLAEVIDLELMSQSEISRFLSWCISTSSGRYPIAESKWECDRKFVDSYRFNPTCFLIAGNIGAEKR